MDLHLITHECMHIFPSKTSNDLWRMAGASNERRTHLYAEHMPVSTRLGLHCSGDRMNLGGQKRCLHPTGRTYKQCPSRQCTQVSTYLFLGLITRTFPTSSLSNRYVTERLQGYDNQLKCGETVLHIFIP
jgi:hypothetical protein